MRSLKKTEKLRKERKLLGIVALIHSKYFLNKYVFKVDLNLGVEEFFKYDGVVFQSEGAAWENDRSP